MFHSLGSRPYSRSGVTLGSRLRLFLVEGQLTSQAASDN